MWSDLPPFIGQNKWWIVWQGALNTGKTVCLLIGHLMGERLELFIMILTPYTFSNTKKAVFVDNYEI
jgi:hypothetical protein